MREHFVCVRITSMNHVDLNRFQFDYDVTWNSFFLNAELDVYSRYGGRDHGEPEARLSKESLLQTMREVLAVHKRRLEGSTALRDAFQPIERPVSTPEDIPLLKSNHRGCVHCHQVREYQLLQANQDGTFSREDLFPYPLPENLGIVIDHKHGHRVGQVIADSPAAQAGLRVGDVVERVDDVPIRSEYDIRWALHRLGEGQMVGMTVQRVLPDGASLKDVSVEVRLPQGWRQTELGWRKSMRSVPFPIGFRGYSLTRSQLRDEKLPEDHLALRMVSVRGGGLGQSLGLERKDLIIALGTETQGRSFDEFKSDLLRRFKPGDVVELTVLRGNERLVLTGKFPQWFTDETTVP